METQTGAADPILRLLEDAGGIDPQDRFMFQLVSLTDVVKNDMKKVLKWDETTINQRLQTLIRTGLDDNLRYRIRPDEKGHGPPIERPLHYTEAQCLLTEWLCLYRTVHLYLGIRQKAA